MPSGSCLRSKVVFRFACAIFGPLFCFHFATVCDTLLLAWWFQVTPERIHPESMALGPGQEAGRIYLR